MSRSYRKPWITDGFKGSKTKQFYKKQANHLIRSLNEVPDGKSYRKFYESWNICDYKFFAYDNEKPWFFNRK